MAGHAGFSPWIVIYRVSISTAILCTTYNPYGYSYWHWITGQWDVPFLDEFWGWKFLITMMLLIAFFVMIRDSYKSIGVVGYTLAIAFVTASIRLIDEIDVLPLEDPDVWKMTLIVGLGFIFGIGLSWAYFRAFLTGQIDAFTIGT